MLPLPAAQTWGFHLQACPPQHQGSYNSDTYHLWALIGTSNIHGYMDHTNASTWLNGLWDKYKHAVTCSLVMLTHHPPCEHLHQRPVSTLSSRTHAPDTRDIGLGTCDHGLC